MGTDADTPTTLTLRIPVLVCRDKSYSAWGHGTTDGPSDADVACLYDGLADKPDTDLRMITVTVEVNLAAVFASATVAGRVEP